MDEWIYLHTVLVHHVLGCTRNNWNHCPFWSRAQPAQDSFADQLQSFRDVVIGVTATCMSLWPMEKSLICVRITFKRDLNIRELSSYNGHCLLTNHLLVCVQDSYGNLFHLKDLLYTRALWKYMWKYRPVHSLVPVSSCPLKGAL